MKILAVGNSFSGNATKYLREIVRSARGGKWVFSHAYIGGCSLEKHYKLAMLHERRSSASEGRPYPLNNRKMSLKAMLKMEEWDFVTIQQNSMNSFQIETYRPWARLLFRYIKKYAPQAEIVFHQTWAYREDDKALFNRKFTSKMMHAELTHAYKTIAAEIGIKRIIPVGDAFQQASSSRQWNFTPDKKFADNNPGHPHLPREKHSLHAGYRWYLQGNAHVLGFDSHHANIAGQYLGGCVWMEFFFGKDCRKIRFKPEEITEKDARILRAIAHQATQASKA